MVLGKVFERFAEYSPVTVMMRGIMEYVVPPERLDEIFREQAQEQYEDELLFSSAVNVLALAVTGVRKSVNDAYKTERENLQVSVVSVYNKLKGAEPQVSREIVRDTAARLVPVIDALKTRGTALLPGYRTKILDGNHLAATEHRIKETRTTKSAPLPGKSLVVLEPELRLMTDVFPCEDGHAQERRLLDQVLLTVAADDLWIADRNFCTTEFLFSIHNREAGFIIRQHALTLTDKQLCGRKRMVGRCDSGVVYEQTLRISNRGVAEGAPTELELRRITVKLDGSTRDGDREIHILTNVPGEVADAITIAELYRKRWTIENAFQELGQALRGEINTLCYPKAALLAFCIALYTYNVLSVLKAAMRAVHKDAAAIERISGYYLAAEISAAYFGMMIAIPGPRWTKAFGHLTARQLAGVLKELSANIRIDRFLKNSRGPKKPPPKRKSAKNTPHVSTKRLLDQRKRTTTSRKPHQMTA
jgi:IS4 transposase